MAWLGVVASKTLYPGLPFTAETGLTPASGYTIGIFSGYVLANDDKFSFFEV